MSIPSKTDWAYVAAMMDGEGSFTISKSRGKSKTTGNPYWMFDCKVMVSNTSLPLMKWLVDHFGGSYTMSVKHISKKAKENGQKSIKPCYRWTVDSYKAQELFLLAILPYIVIKREQAKTALEYVRMIGVKDPVTRMNLHNKMKALNRGESPETNTLNSSPSELKIESELHSDMQSAPVVTQETTITPIVGEYAQWYIGSDGEGNAVKIYY